MAPYFTRITKSTPNRSTTSLYVNSIITTTRHRRQTIPRLSSTNISTHSRTTNTSHFRLFKFFPTKEYPTPTIITTSLGRQAFIIIQTSITNVSRPTFTTTSRTNSSLVSQDVFQKSSLQTTPYHTIIIQNLHRRHRVTPPTTNFSTIRRVSTTTTKVTPR